MVYLNTIYFNKYLIYIAFIGDVSQNNLNASNIIFSAFQFIFPYFFTLDKTPP